MAGSLWEARAACQVSRPPGAQMDDTVITARTKKSLLEPERRALTLTVFCRRRLAVPAGVVDRRERIHEMVRVARSVAGVVAVRSFLHVKVPPSRRPTSGPANPAVLTPALPAVQAVLPFPWARSPREIFPGYPK